MITAQSNRSVAAAHHDTTAVLLSFDCLLTTKALVVVVTSRRAEMTIEAITTTILAELRLVIGSAVIFAVYVTCNNNTQYCNSTVSRNSTVQFLIGKLQYRSACTGQAFIFQILAKFSSPHHTPVPGKTHTVSIKKAMRQ